MVVVSRVDYHRWRDLAWPLLLGTLFLLLIPLLPFTHRISPRQRGPALDSARSAQPPALRGGALHRGGLGGHARRQEGRAVRGFKKGVAPFLVVLGMISLLILLEPNLSMAVLVSLIGGVVLFAAGAKIGHFLLLGVAGVFAAVSMIWAEPYRLVRLRCFLEPCGQGNFQLTQALLGFGSGGPLGVGFGHGQLKLKYLPYAVFRLPLQHDRGGMGVSRRHCRGKPVQRVLLARLPDRPDGS